MNASKQREKPAGRGLAIRNSYLDLALDRAQRRIPMTMEDWAKQLDRFLELTERGILTNAGSVTAEAAKAHALCEFQRYRVVQEKDYESDFDRLVNREGSAGDESLTALEQAQQQTQGRKRKSETPKQAKVRNAR